MICARGPRVVLLLCDQLTFCSVDQQHALVPAGRPHGGKVSYVSALIHKTHAMITTASSSQSERKKALAFASVATSVSGDDNSDADTKKKKEQCIYLSSAELLAGERDYEHERGPP